MARIRPLNPARTAWDYYKQFYETDEPFVIFASGEMIVTDSTPHPSLRRYYNQFNVTLGMTTDDDSVLFFDPECLERVPQAWLTQGGGQYYTADHDTGVAVRLQHWADGQKDVRLPAWLRGRASAYFGGMTESRAHGVPNGQVHAPPIGAPFEVSRPLVLTKEEKEHLATMKAVCAAWCAHTGYVRDEKFGGGYYLTPGGTRRPGNTTRRSDVKDVSIENLTEEHRIHIGLYEWAEERAVESVTQLYVPKRLDL